MSTENGDYLNARDFLRKASLYTLRLTTSAWARKNLFSSLGRRLKPGSRSDRDRPTKTTVHPFDKETGTDTSGETVFHELRSGLKADAYATGYLGCEPSVLRHTISTLPNREKAIFIDLGCGKGRAAIVASEFEFRAVIGVELSPRLSAIAASNANIIAQRFPNRCDINIVQGDATTFEIPVGLSVIYMYHPFERPVMKKVVKSCENAVMQGDREIFLVYQRPIIGSVIDQSVCFTRYSAEMIPLDSSELPFSQESSATVVVWRGAKDTKKEQILNSPAHRRIRVNGLAAILES